MKTHGSAVWQGGIKDGKGAISTKSGALKDYPYGFSSRFEGKPGTNPEELIGAAHAGCFTMALSLILGEAKLTAERMDTTAEVTLEKVADGFAITAVHLTLRAKVPGRGPGQVRRARRQGQGRLSRFQAPERQDHPGRDAGRLISDVQRRLQNAGWIAAFIVLCAAWGHEALKASRAIDPAHRCGHLDLPDPGKCGPAGTPGLGRW